jgi:adenosine kinase
MGCVGEDEYSQKMRDACKADGVNALYMVDKSVPTGTCAVCITGNDRSLVANLSAANNYKASHCQESSNWAVVSGAKIIYSAGFFATVSPEAIELASQQAGKSGATYCMNLSAPFLMQVPPFKAVFVKTIPYVDFLFGNETEARTWAETEGWDTQDVSFIATRLSLIPSAKGKHRYVVITQGADSTCIAHHGHCTEYPILKLDKSKIVDTNGAGDAYVGGFLAGLAKGKDIKACHEAGAYSASIIIQQSGCVCPGTPEHKL